MIKMPEAYLSKKEYQRIMNSRERMQNLSQRKQVTNQQKTIMIDGRYFSVPKSYLEYPYCPNCKKHVSQKEAFYNGCPKCETPLMYDSNGTRYPFTKEMIAEREKQRIRDEKWTGASRLGKIGLWLGEFADELMDPENRPDLRGGGGGSSGIELRSDVRDYLNQSSWMKHRLNNWANEHGWCSYLEYLDDK
jgi:hypothetical protein